VKDETLNIDHLKPVMKSLEDVKQIETMLSQGGDYTILSAKADGEFTYVHYERDGESYCANRWQRKTTNFPALDELVEALKGTQITKAEILAELYGIENGKPVPLPKLIHFIKGGEEKLYDNLFLGIFEIVSVNDLEIREPYHWKLEEAQKWFKDCSHVHVLPWAIAKSRNELIVNRHIIASCEDFWNHYVNLIGYEGIIVRNAFGIFKLKPLLEIDAVIIGINKQNKGFKEQTARSLKLALRNQDGTFAEIGDVSSGITVELGKKLWQLTQQKVGEDNESVLVKPIVVINVQFNAMYPKTKNRVFMFEPFKEVGSQTLMRMRHPKFVKFRTDKTPCIQDIGLNQVPLENGCA
jgi:ATP-dependent DNA ligase